MHSATSQLQRFFTERAVDERVRIVLRPSVLIPELGAEVVLERDVIVTLVREPVYGVSWLPSDHGPFPRMIGRLALADDPPGASRLILTGSTQHCTSQFAHRFHQAIAKALLVYLSHHLDEPALTLPI